MDLRSLCDYLQSFKVNTKLSTSTSSTSTSTSSVSSEVSSEPFFKGFYEHTLFLGDKEASGHFGSLHGISLQKRHPNKKYYIDNELKVFRFSSDAALIVSSTVKRMDVVFYKPYVSAKLQQPSAFYLSELFLQAFYLANQCEHSIVHCLTDLVDYHLFLVAKDGKKLCIQKYWHSECDLKESSQTAEHLRFLSEIMLLP